MKLYIIVLSALSLLLTACVTTSSTTTDKTSDQKKAGSHYHLGIASMYKGKYYKAKRELSLAVKYGPDVPFYHNHLGLLYFKLGYYEKAEKQYRRAQELDNTYSDALNNLAVLYIEQKKYKEARELLEKVRNDPIYPHPHFVHTNLGIIFREQGDLTAAEEQFKRALKLKSKDCQAHAEIALLYEMKHLEEKAAHHYKKAVDFCPSFAEALYRGAVRLLALKREEEGREFLRRCLTLKKNNVNELDIPFLDDCVRLAKRYGITEESEKKPGKKREIMDIQR